MTTARGVTALLLLVIGTLLAIGANVGLWVDRTVYDTDGFVSTTQEVFQDEEVQALLARELADTLIRDGNLESRLYEELPRGLKFLALPLTDALADYVERLALRILGSDRFEAVYERALTTLHQQLMRVINSSDLISSESGTLVIDLRPLLDALLEEIGLDESTLGGDEGIIRNVELREDAGRFVIEDSAIAWTYRIARYGDDIIELLIVAVVVVFALAFVVAPRRRAALSRTGIALVFVGFISLVVLVPVRMFASRLMEEGEAVLSVIAIISGPFRTQSFVLIGVGVVFVAVAFVLGESRLAVSLRSTARRREGASFGALAREHGGQLRAIGIVVGVIALIAWPEPTPRVQVTILAILGAYLLALWALTGESSWARSVREQGGAMASSYFGAPEGVEDIGWVGAHAGMLRLIGVALALVGLILIPSLTFGTLVSIALLLLAWIAAVEWLSGRAESS
jgi:hypothetical protein